MLLRNMRGWGQIVAPRNLTRAFTGKRYYVKEVIDAEYISGSEDEHTEASLPIADRVRSLVELRISGTLSSLAVKMKSANPQSNPQEEDDAAPTDSPPLWASVMPYAMHNSQPVFGVFPEERHASNLFLHKKASLVVFSLTPSALNPATLPVPRVNVTGEAEPVEDDEITAVKEKFLQVHPKAKEYIDSYNYFTLRPQEVVWYNQGPIDVVSGEEFLRATADPVSVESRKMLTTFNSDKNPRLLELLCKEYAGERVKEAFMFHVDRFGFNVLAKSYENDQWQEFRFPFPFEMRDKEEAATAIAEAMEKVQQNK